MAKDSVSGLIFKIVRMLLTQKTVSSRKLLFKMLHKYLVVKDLEYSFVRAKDKRITLKRDFETSFAKAFAKTLCEVFHLHTPTKNI